MKNIDLASLNSLSGFKILGAASDDAAGSSLANAGDVNNDGIDDILIGAKWASPNDRHMAGAAYVVYGKSNILGNIDLMDLTESQGFAILGASANDSTGYSVSGAGDINNDGIDDIIIGAYRASLSFRNGAGIVYVIYGKNTVLSHLLQS